MYVFNYDPQTLAYTGGTPAVFCQLEPGNVLAPAWSSKNAPPPGWNSAVEWPYFVPQKNAWEIRPLPVPVPAEPPAASAEPPAGEQTDALKATLQAHIDAAQRIVDELKGSIDPETTTK